MHKIMFYFLLGSSFLGPCVLALSPEPSASGSDWHILPKGRLFQLTVADPREIRMALESQGASRIDAHVGNYFSLLGLTLHGPTPLRFYLGIEGAGYFTMRQQSSRFPLETTDGLLGIYIDGDYGPWQMQFRYTHVSAHLSDGSSDSPIQFSREHLALRAAYLFSQWIHCYGGVRYLVNTMPSLEPWAFQVGATAFLPWHWGKLTPYTGIDFQYKQDSTINPSLNLQIGIALNNPPEAFHSFRFFYAYFTGSDPRGQYYMQHRTAHSFGIEMQI